MLMISGEVFMSSLSNEKFSKKLSFSLFNGFVTFLIVTSIVFLVSEYFIF